MNRYKQLLGVFVVCFGTVLVLSRCYLMPSATKQTVTPVTTIHDSPNTSVLGWPLLPTNTTELTAPKASATRTPPVSLAALFEQLRALLAELDTLYATMNLNADPEQTDVSMSWFRAQFDELLPVFNDTAQQALTLNRNATQVFLWEQMQENHNVELNYILLDMLQEPNDALFAQILQWLDNAGAALDLRQSIAYRFLSERSTTYDYEPSTTAPKPAAKTVMSARQRQILAFLEAHLQTEPTPELLNTYLDVYYELCQSQASLGNARFRQQLDLLQGRLSPERYYDYRLRELNLGDANTDYASLLQEMARASLTSVQRLAIARRLADDVVGRLSAAVSNGTDNTVAPEHRVLLQHFIEQQIAATHFDNLADIMKFYDYGTLRFAAELLHQREGAQERLYQQLLASQSLPEQVGLFYALPYSDGEIQKRVREHSHLLADINAALTKPGLSEEQRTILQATANMLRPEVASETNKPDPALYGSEPHTELNQSVDEYGNPTYRLDVVNPDGSTVPSSDTTPATVAPAP